MAESKKKEPKQVHLPRARAGEERDLFVGINGKNYIIPKGKAVDVPPEVFAEIERSKAASDVAYEREETLRSKSTTI